VPSTHAEPFVYEGPVAPGDLIDRYHELRVLSNRALDGLGPLPADELAEHIAARFADDRRDAGEGLGPLLDASEGHPRRAMLLAHHVYEQVEAGREAGIEQWAAADEGVRREAEGEILVLWESCTA